MTDCHDLVVAEDRYVAADAADLVEVEYEELPVLVDPTKSMAADAPILRDDLKDKTSGAHGPRKHPNHVFTWAVGDAAGTARVLSEAAVVAKERIVYQRVSTLARSRPAAVSPRWTR